METRIARWGNSHGVRFSREVMEQAGLAAGDIVQVEVDEGRVTLVKRRRVRGRYRLEDLVARIPQDSTAHEEFWGDPVGREEW